MTRIALHVRVETMQGYHSKSTTYAVFDKNKGLCFKCYCKKTPCRRMGFTQKASCRPYKNCYTRRK